MNYAGKIINTPSIFIKDKVMECWIGTHAEYDKLCKQNKQYTVFDY